jgi:hypothetical protein
MANKERFTTTLDGELLRRIKILAIHRRCSTNVLLEEAISDLLRKYDSQMERDNLASRQPLSSQTIHEPSSGYDRKTKA